MFAVGVLDDRFARLGFAARLVALHGEMGPCNRHQRCPSIRVRSLDHAAGEIDSAVPERSFFTLLQGPMRGPSGSPPIGGRVRTDQSLSVDRGCVDGSRGRVDSTGSDHAGYRLKSKLIRRLSERYCVACDEAMMAPGRGGRRSDATSIEHDGSGR